MKEELNRIKNLMERLEHPYGRLLYEAKDRIQVTRDELQDLFNELDDNAKNTAGTFISMTYVKGAEVYKIKKNWRPDAVSSVLDKYKDQADSDWHKSLTTFNKPETKGKNPIWTIVLCSRSKIHYQSKEGFKNAQIQHMNNIDDIRVSHGLPNKFGDPTLWIDDNGAGGETTHKGNQVKRYNMASATKISPTEAYLLSPEGNIVTKLPIDVVYAMKKPYSDDVVEKAEYEILGDNKEKIASYEKAVRAENEKFKHGVFNFDQLLTCAFGFNGKSYYFINDKLQMTSKGSAGINVNPQEWIKIAEDQLDENFKAIEGFNTEKERYI